MKTEQEHDEQLDRAIAKLPKKVMPARDLWPELASQLPDRADDRRRWLRARTAWAAAAVFALAAFLSWHLLLIPGTGAPEPQINLSQGNLNSETNASSPAAAQVLVQEFEAGKAERLANIGSVSKDFGDWRYQLNVWDKAIAQIQNALIYSPGDPALLAQMQDLYRQQLNYLQLIAAVDTHNYSWTESEL